MSVEILISLPEAMQPVSAVRSTLIQASLESLRRRGHYDRYLRLVDPGFRDRIVGTIAPEWLDIDLALAHYEACDALALDHDEILELGQVTGERIQETFVAMTVRRARVLGLTPWEPLAQFQRLWDRLVTGGGIGLARTGPKEARVEMCLMSVARYAYFRGGFSGTLSSAIKLGAGRNVNIRVLPSVEHDKRCVFRCSWL